MHLLTEVTQGALLFGPDNKLLILQLPNGPKGQKSDGKWLLPGGRLHVQEKWIDGLLREIEEETKITDVEVGRVLGVDNWMGFQQPQYGVYFLCKTATPNVILSKEHKGFAWITREEIHQFPYLHPHLPALLEMAFAEKAKQLG
ncbi:MAG: hypothetical protein JWM56_840 [Candidatus Peribacteria bacterium]|nr:hypothetical protein [Candidatus Peribacteria bacterium]